MPAPRRFLRLLWIPLVLLGVVAGWKLVFARLAATPPKDVELLTDIVYGQGGGRDLRLDLTRPRTPADRRPAIVFIHGGGWVAGDRKDFYPFMFQFSRAGIVCVSVQYRFAPAHRFPAQIEDVKCAVRWLRAHAAEYDIDPDRIAALGISAGAHLAALLATTPGVAEFEGAGGHAAHSSAIRTAICLAGPYDLTLGYRSSGGQRPSERATIRHLLPALLGGTPDELPDAYRRASPITYAQKSSPPMLLVHGAADPLVLVEQAEVFAQKLREAGAPVQFLRLEDGTHDSFGRNPEKALSTIADYVRQQFQIPEQK